MNRTGNEITPRKEVKSNFLSSKKTLEAFSTNFSSNKKESSRVLNMKDMNSNNLQLNSKINNCFGDFYKKLDTFADRVSKKDRHQQNSGPTLATKFAETSGFLYGTSFR